MCKLRRITHKLNKDKNLNFFPYNINFGTKQHICNVSKLKATEGKKFETAVYERWGSHLENYVSSKLCYAK